MLRLSLKQAIHEATARKGPRQGSFEFGETEIFTLCKKLVSLITERLWNNQSVNGKGKQKISVTSPIDDKIHKINFRLIQELDQNEFLKGPKASWDFKAQEIKFYVPDQLLWFAETPEHWENQFYQNFIHELTHVFDVKGNADYVRGNYAAPHEHDKKLSDEENEKLRQQKEIKYFRDPAEVKAFLTQVTTEMRWNLQGNPSITRPEQLLDSSQTWSQYKHFWSNSPNRMKLFLRAAFDVLRARQ